MRKSIAVLALIMVACTASAQNATHEYMIVYQMPISRSIAIYTSKGDPQIVELKAINGKDQTKDVASFLQKIEALEEEGWTVFEIQVPTVGDVGNNYYYWVMRRPKQ